MIQGTCFKCGLQADVIHHISYNPEVIAPCCHKCHNEIHRRIRKEGKCKFSVEEVERMSRQSTFKRYREKPEHKKYSADYAKKNHRKIDFLEKLNAHVYHREHINFNLKTGSVSVSCGFMTDGSLKLPEVNLNGK